MGEVVTTTPTIGFNVESLVYKNVNLTVWVCTKLVHGLTVRRILEAKIK